MAAYLTLDHLPASSQTVMVRVDFNLPEKEGGYDLTRLDRSLVTLKELLQKKHQVILLAHFGRPKGRPVESLSLKPIADILMQKLAPIKVAFAQNFKDLETLQKEAVPVILFENIRFFEGEEKNDPAFAKQLSSFAQSYVNDAFSVSHRAHASIVGIPQFLKTYAGRLLEYELILLERYLSAPQKPMMAIIGGSKISTKFTVIETLFIGGAMAHTFLYAEGHEIGRSLYEPDYISKAKDILRKAAAKNISFLLPQDAVVQTPQGQIAEKNIKNISPEDKIMDIGQQTFTLLEQTALKAQTILWNGPLGAFEMPPFHKGTFTLCALLKDLCKAKKKRVIAGGGDSISALEATGTLHDLTYVSMGGGAFLEWMEGKSLPGLKSLSNSDQL
jgi:phosphoglycerate kinase